ncbi:MAG TPA: superoxide dismutase family protein [Bacillota bacterium]|nr:superoxide dismutase family protein [Bacillota bacterium]
MTKHLLTTVLGLSIIVLMSACQTDNPQTEEKGGEEPGIETSGQSLEEAKEVEVALHNTEGDEVGRAVLMQQTEGVRIDFEGWDLPPGEHGFHIHEKGVCDPPDFESAGEHFNPTNAKHGFDHPKGPHAGDLPNLKVEKDGTAKATYVAEMVTLEKDKKNSLIGDDGTSLVIHADADDYKSQPAGDAGDRIACGAIIE